jgi:cation transport ATPase
MSDNLSNMKKVTARDFQHGFSKHAHGLKPGQSVVVTKHGKTVGVFTRTDVPRREKPNFLAELEKHAYSEKDGQRIIDTIVNDSVL